MKKSSITLKLFLSLLFFGLADGAFAQGNVKSEVTIYP